jgi:hypothetical protein
MRACAQRVVAASTVDDARSTGDQSVRFSAPEQSVMAASSSVHAVYVAEHVE